MQPEMNPLYSPPQSSPSFPDASIVVNWYVFDVCFSIFTSCMYMDSKPYTVLLSVFNIYINGLLCYKKLLNISAFSLFYAIFFM